MSSSAAPGGGGPPDMDELDVQGLVRLGLRGARRVIVAVVGGTVVLAGIAMLVLPGPGLVVIPIGLAVLSTEFVWARRWLKRIRARIEASTRPRSGADGAGPGDRDPDAWS